MKIGRKIQKINIQKKYMKYTKKHKKDNNNRLNNQICDYCCLSEYLRVHNYDMDA